LSLARGDFSRSIFFERAADLCRQFYKGTSIATTPKLSIAVKADEVAK
jgi:hypothetical protein